MKRTIAAGLTGIAAMLLANTVMAGDAKVFETKSAINNLSTVMVDGGKARDLTIGLGSGAYRRPGDPANMFYAVSDRGPNFVCRDVETILGVSEESVCHGNKVRVYPTPDYSPSIYTIFLGDDGSFDIKDVITIKDQNGVPLTGLTNKLTVAKTEKPVDANGNELAQSVSSIDSEGIIRLSDGSYWLGEENGPSILRVAADGTVIERIVPFGSQDDFKEAGYKVTGGLPAILVKRQTNRGIESMAVSPDETKLYFMVQNPLANPNADAYKAAKNTRLFVFDRASEKLTGEYIYQLDDPQSFRNDPSKKQNAPRVSEVLALGNDRLLVLERTDKTTKLHEVKLDGATNILATRWDDMSTSPTLEQQNDLASIELKAVSKTLRFDSADYPMAPNKLEGLAILGDGSLAMINDNDFGIKGDPTKVIVIDGLVKADKY
ncbi:esterase-like activity of phytase family protein [Thalassospira lucentensis]|uniref:esterase-like activity of phytase family protein n=1 Tax=Thalassospira lucentensis TaxID=168935 RepID=UPI00142E7F21|nr:esterase-like activity of phytase family protein [Thalassospira lucentensis]NIZ01836.1 esterase-like activity of phytase family protein [Thalassospira lucentensis]